MMNDNTKKIIMTVIPIVIALFSFFVVAKYATSAEFHAKTIAALDEKKTTVMELTAASTAASAAVTLLPGDTATPIAEKLADLSTYFLVVLCAIYIEKYLVTITGYAAFNLIIPIACVLCSINVFVKNDAWKYLAKKLSIFGIAIVLVIPVSVKVSELIEATYESSIEETIETAKQATEGIEGAEKSEGGAAEAEEKDSEQEAGWLSGLFSKVEEGVSDMTAKATEKVENILNDFMDALAVMLVTSCVIPIVVLLFFVWLVKILLGVNINLPKKMI